MNCSRHVCKQEDITNEITGEISVTKIPTTKKSELKDKENAFAKQDSITTTATYNKKNVDAHTPTTNASKLEEKENSAS